MNKRKWCYVMSPVSYEMACDKCGGTNITWSEWEDKIWCHDCQIDIDGFPGIFDGPIPLGVSATLGISFDRINLETQNIQKAVINKTTKEFEYISEEEYIKRRAVTLLSGEKELDDFDDIIKKGSKSIKFKPSTPKEKEEFRKIVLDWGKENGSK